MRMHLGAHWIKFFFIGVIFCLLLCSINKYGWIIGRSRSLSEWEGKKKLRLCVFVFFCYLPQHHWLPFCSMDFRYVWLWIAHFFSFIHSKSERTCLLYVLFPFGFGHSLHSKQSCVLNRRISVIFLLLPFQFRWIID